jgi:hypothetical protein
MMAASQHRATDTNDPWMLEPGAHLAVRGENISNAFGLAGLGNANDRTRAHV